MDLLFMNSTSTDVTRMHLALWLYQIGAHLASRKPSSCASEPVIRIDVEQIPAKPGVSHSYFFRMGN